MKTPTSTLKKVRRRRPRCLATCVRLAAILTLAICNLGDSKTLAQSLRAEKILEWKFSNAEDKNSDALPDDWQRLRDRAHPFYIETLIVPRDLQLAKEAAAAKKLLVQLMHAYDVGRWDPYYIPEVTPPALAEFLDEQVLDNCLEIRMDGGGAEMHSPVFPMDPRFSYRIQAEQSTIGLNGHDAWLELQLLDDNQDVLDSIATAPISGSNDWKTFVEEANSPAGGQLRWGRVLCKVEPKQTAHIKGIARFDNIRIYRMPRLTLSTDIAHNVAEPNQSIHVDCKAMGIKSHVNQVLFQLRDIDGILVSQAEVELNMRGESKESSHLVSSERKRGTSTHLNLSTQDAYDGIASWEFRIPNPGLYRVSVDLGQDTSVNQRRELLLSVLETQAELDAGPFGWSIPSFTPTLSTAELPELATRFGAKWVKYPIWFDDRDDMKAEQIASMTDRLQAFSINCVGVFDQPPASQRNDFGPAADELYAVNMFRESETWEPLLEPVLTRIGMKLTWFQFGSDLDLSFAGSSEIEQILRDIRARLQTYCQELQLVVGWDWIESPPPSGANQPWNAVHYRSTPQLTQAELRAYSSAAGEKTQATWVNLLPLSKSNYRLVDRVKDLCERMIEIRRSNLQAAFLYDPANAETGLLNEDGSATELLIPWHTLVSHLGKGTYVGSVKLPGHSVNHVFENAEGGTMVLWNPSQTKEQIFLGKEIEVSDIWGKSVPVEQVERHAGLIEQRFEVGKWPIFVRGVNTNIIRWRQKFDVQVTNLASRVGSGLTLPITLANTFEDSISGNVTLVCESLIASGKANIQLQLRPGQVEEMEIPIDLRADASAGEHELRFAFEVDTSQKYVFSVYRSVVLGLGDIQITWDANRVDSKDVQIRFEVINNTPSPVSFDCKIFPPGRPYERFQIIDAEPGTSSREVTLSFPETDELQEHWIRCEGIGSGRILNYRVKL